MNKTSIFESPFNPNSDFSYIRYKLCNERSKGTGVTILVQSSSITLSTLTPLCGIGVVEIDRAYSMNVGADIGTTFTSLIAALASTGSGFINSLQVSLGK